MKLRRSWKFVIAVVLVVAPAAAAAPRGGAQTSTTAPSPQVMKLLEEGSALFMKHDYKSAVGPYSKALELEKQQPTLDKTLWRVLVDNLGMAYGISGDLTKAEETFDYGVSKDGTYPMFYYNLACTYAEKNDVDKTIVNLKLAFKYEANMNEGEEMPDPASDDSFQRFLTDEKFRAALSEIGKARQ